MTPERWQQVKEILGGALETAPLGRAVFLEQACGGDADLRQEVESLLASDTELAPEQSLNSQFLGNVTLPQSAAAILPQEAEPWVGRSVGPYKIVEQIGVGGMGEVYRAVRDDDQYRKQVAVKVVRAGQDSALVLTRFKNERQILASLDHPNIARLLDGGTTKEGAAYFVMELIVGQPLDQYCNERNLSIDDRLQLFLQICSAVQYAHQRLIIHRDIKPGNILVTSEGAPKLLDFGIAKLLEINTDGVSAEDTLTGFGVLTPAYASPEQVKSEAITTASDVYSLGVVLYELLTGSSPYHVTSHAPHEMARAICEVEPARPSTALRQTLSGESPSRPSSQKKNNAVVPDAMQDSSLRKRGKLLQGDLDNIVLMALRKEPQRRYISVEQFAEDIRRHLDDLPVIARKDTAGYRATKFVTRHRAGFVATVLSVAVLLAALVVTVRQARIARQQAEIASQQRARAERRFNDVRKLANSLMFEIHDSIKDLNGATEARRLLVTRALEYLDSLSKEAGNDLSLQRELAAAYDKVGDVLGYEGNANLGDSAGALQSYGKALAIRESLAANNPTDAGLQRELLGAYFRLSWAHSTAGDPAGALATLQKGAPLVTRIAAGQTNPRISDLVAGYYYLTAKTLNDTGNPTGALENYRRAAVLREPVAANEALDPLVRAHLVADYSGMARTLVILGNGAEALTLSNKALVFIKQLSGAHPENGTLREFVGESYSIHRAALARVGDFRGAFDDSQRELEIYSGLLAADPANSLARNNVDLSEIAAGEMLVEQGKAAAAIGWFRKAKADATQRVGGKDRYASTCLGTAYNGMGKAYAALAAQERTTSGQARDWRQAKSWFEQGLRVWKEKANQETRDDFGKKEGDNAAEGIAKCDAALAKLRGR